MTVEYHLEVEQGSPEWHALRCGIVTASEFHKVLMEGQKKGSPSKTRRKYMLGLIAETLSGEVCEGYTNAHMERGKLMEDEARNYYAFQSDLEPIRVGFIKNGRTGCSPDSLIGNDGLLEVKTKLPDLQLEALLDDCLPSEHVAQVQGQLWVSGREFCDFVSYWPKLPALMKRVYRDEPYIKKLEQAVTQFLEEMDALADAIQTRAAA